MINTSKHVPIALIDTILDQSERVNMQLYSLKRASEILDCSVYGLRKFIKQGFIRPIRFGRHVKLNQEMIEAICKKGVVTNKK